MSWKLARKDMSLLIRNPITYLGIIFMIWIVVFTVSPFWNLYGNVRDEKSSVVYDSEGEIEAGYIPTTTEVVYQNVMQELRKSLISDCSLSEEVADKEIQKIQENEWSMDQIAQGYQGKIQYLLPVYLTNMKKPDLAMTLEVMDGYYMGHTCLTLEMAYLNARVIARPLAPWLTELVR